jgi:hypothetical protein
MEALRKKSKEQLQLAQARPEPYASRPAARAPRRPRQHSLCGEPFSAG